MMVTGKEVLGMAELASEGRINQIPQPKLLGENVLKGGGRQGSGHPEPWLWAGTAGPQRNVFLECS